MPAARAVVSREFLNCAGSAAAVGFGLEVAVPPRLCLLTRKPGYRDVCESVFLCDTLPLIKPKNFPPVVALFVLTCIFSKPCLESYELPYSESYSLSSSSLDVSLSLLGACFILSCERNVAAILGLLASIGGNP